LKLGVEKFIINGADLMWPGVERITVQNEELPVSKIDKKRLAFLKQL
jgi:predicted ribosome-associated RNA-binding protein Tma20